MALAALEGGTTGRDDRDMLHNVAYVFQQECVRAGGREYLMGAAGAAGVMGRPVLRDGVIIVGPWRIVAISPGVIVPIALTS